MEMAAKRRAKLVLRSGDTFEGYSFGAPRSTAGEVVFTTGMVGYPESLTDPSYHGQLLVLTSPMVGNYGIPALEYDAFGITKVFESQGGKIHAAAVIVSEYCEEPNHWQSCQTLDSWLKGQDVPGLMMVDTRAIVLKLRELGTALGKIVVEDDEVEFSDPNTRNLVAEVSTKKRTVYGYGDIRILCIDMGIKLNTVRCFLKHDVQFIVVPHDWDITGEEYDGLFISNGPGDPTMCAPTIRSVRWALQHDKPIFGICMGNQMLALAAGGKTYKMKFGHRGQNQPCRFRNEDRVVITTQNHGYAVDFASMPEDWDELLFNPNDGSCEGIRHKTKPFSAVQFHPEGRCGPQDTEFMFADFVTKVKLSKIKEVRAFKPRKVLVLGAGGITIAQAGEFDYSGSQCLKSLREEGIETVLVNPNIATVQTDHGMADQVYFVPVQPESVEKVIAQERPDGILLGWGGQTALNCGVQLEKLGILQKYNVRVLGTPVSTIALTEDRELFRDALLQINEHVARSAAVTSIEAAVEAATRIGYPLMVRAAFCLGGQGSGIVADEPELREKVEVALAIAPQVLIEESVAGWKEIEYEVVRDIYDNCITVCNMENIDPMGIHTGESMVVAPSQTLTNDEYHMLRTAAIKIIRHLGVVGECNIQYGLDPKSSRYVVIEVNARLSRSSALASKATGYPLAHVAAKIALGKSLSEIANGVTKTTNACFEPALDYIVVKIPRWDLSKFNMVSQRIGSMMKSVGEVMAIGRTFEEAFQKALRMVDPSNPGFEVPSSIRNRPEPWDVEDELRNPTPNRVWAIRKALEDGKSVDDVFALTQINRFFLCKMQNIVRLSQHLGARFHGQLASIDKNLLWTAKAHGFSDRQIASAVGSSEDAVFARRHELGVVPKVKQIDTVAGEFPAYASYLYSSYNAQTDDVSFTEPMHVVLGCGVYRIGNSVEFDYCGVLVAREMRRLGHKVIMINYNPETVSTDYDECDRLYFEEVSKELIRDILSKEKPLGIVISVGGQIVQNLALELKKVGLPVMGTDPTDIDKAEDRNKFSAMCDAIGVPQPEWISATSLEQVHGFSQRVGFPILVRPSYVLSGSAMSVISNGEDIDRYLSYASRVSGDHPVVVSKYHDNAVEYDVDVVAHYGKVLCYSICEHIENAGVHSGDATMFLPPQRHADHETMRSIYDAACKVAEQLNVIGPMNLQLLKTDDGQLKVIEANVRCSRSIPFVSKTLGISFPAVIVSALLAKADTKLVPIKRAKMTHIGCKAAMFSFNRLANADPILGVEMSSTGEVGVFGRDKHEVLLKAMICQNFKYPKDSALLAFDVDTVAAHFVPFAKHLQSKLKLYATPQTAAVLRSFNVAVEVLHPPLSKETPNVREVLAGKRVDLVVQIRDRSKDFLLKRVTRETAPDDYWIRRLAADYGIPLITELHIAELFAEAFVKYAPADLEIQPFKHYVPKIYNKLDNSNSFSMLKRHKIGLVVTNSTSLESLVIAVRLKEESLDVTCFHADLGAPQGPQELRAQLGIAKVDVLIVDLRDEMAEACFDIIMAMAAHDNENWQIGPIAQHVRGVGLIRAMRARHMTTVAQTSGRNKREMRFERYVKMLCPEMSVYTPWRDDRVKDEFPSDAEKIKYLRNRSIPVVDPPRYKLTANLGGLHYKADEMRLLPPPSITCWPKDCPVAEFVSFTFKAARCVQINGRDVTPLQAMQQANTIGGRNGFGLVRTADGLLYETPGMALLAAALKIVYDDAFDRKTSELFRTYSHHVSANLFDNQYADPPAQSAMAGIRQLVQTVEGMVELELHRGQAIFLRLQRKTSVGRNGIPDMGEDDVFAPGNGQFEDFVW